MVSDAKMFAAELKDTVSEIEKTINGEDLQLEVIKRILGLIGRVSPLHFVTDAQPAAVLISFRQSDRLCRRWTRRGRRHTSTSARAAQPKCGRSTLPCTPTG
jgi:hypothetical protein